MHKGVGTAIAAGYRAFDTAQMYNNESDLGDALANGSVSRENLFITTKVHPDHYTDDLFLTSVEDSLSALRVDAVDMLLLHWPPVGGNIKPSLTLLEQAAAKGYTKHIGVSNYTVQMMIDARSIIDTPIGTNQVEFHPLLNQDKLLEGSLLTGIPLSSYCSVARGEVLRHTLFDEIGKAYGKSPVQIALRWILQKGVSINSLSSNVAHIRANFQIMDFTLSSVAMGQIDKLTQNDFRIVDQPVVKWAPTWD